MLTQDCPRHHSLPRSKLIPMPLSRASLPRVSPHITTFVMVILVIGCLYAAQVVLIPVAVAILLTFSLSPIVVGLQRRGLPRMFAVCLVVMVAVLVISGLIWFLTAQLVSLANDLPKYQENVAKRIAELRTTDSNSLLSKLQSFTDRVARAAATPLPDTVARLAPPQRVVIATNDSWNPLPIIAALYPVIEPLVHVGLVLVLVFYGLVSREDMRNRLVKLISNGHLTQTTLALDDVGQRVSRYLLVQFLLNCTFGVCVGVGLYILGLPYAALWGFLGALLRYIPYVGPFIVTMLPMTFSLLMSDSWRQPVSVAVMFAILEGTNNLFLEPLFFGKSVGVSQAALLVSITFWTWLWGAMGLVLATPLTVCLVVLGKYVPQLKFFDILLGDEEPMTPDLNLYLRLLARDYDNASVIVQEHSKVLTSLQLCDQMMIPALIYSKQDLVEGKLDESEVISIREAVGDLSEEQSFRELAKNEAVFLDIAQQIPTILGCGARDQADEVAMAIFQRAVDQQNYRLEVIPRDRLISEILDQVDEEHPGIICVAALPPGGLAHTRLLCKRLKSRHPTLKIVVARWGLQTEVEENRSELIAAGAAYLGTSMEETAHQLAQLSPLIRNSRAIEAVPSA